MTASEVREWSEQTPAGRFQAAMGVTTVVDYERREAIVEETRSRFRTNYGRELDVAEIDTVRRQAEVRAVTATGGRTFPTSHALAEVLGWGVAVPPKDRGFAKFQDGRWQGDPEIVAASEAADAARAARQAQGFRSTGIGPPT